MTAVPNGNWRRPRLTILGFEAKFWESVDSGEADSCWPWKSGQDQDGYGRVAWPEYLPGRVSNIAHRVAYHFANPQVDITDLEVCHSCDNPPCCNPAHLWPGTHSENITDAIRKGRKKTGRDIWPEGIHPAIREKQNVG